MAQCLSKGKQDEYIGCTGRFFPASTNQTIYCYCILNIMSFSGLSRRVPFAMSLMNQPLQLLIDFNAKANIVFGSSASSYSNTFTCNLIAKQFVPYPTDKENDIKRLAPNEKYTFHFRRIFGLAPITVANTTAQQTVSILGVPAGLVNAVQVHCVSDADEANGNWQLTRTLNNLALLLNSSVLHNYVGGQTLDGQNAYDCLSLVNTSGVTNAVVNYNNGGSNGTSVAPYYMFLLGATSFPEQQMDHEHVSHGISLSAQVLQCRFNLASAAASKLYVNLILEYAAEIYPDGSVVIKPVM